MSPREPEIFVSTRFIAACAAAPAFAASAAVARLYDRPYALAETGRSDAVRDEAQVAVTPIDGNSTRRTTRSDPIPPGRHKVMLHVETARAIFRPEFREVEIDYQPCTRYELVAHCDVSTGPDWEARVCAETIGECVAQFMKDRPAT